MTLTELKQNAEKYVWTLSAHSWGHPKIGIPRKVIKKQTNALKFEDNFWLTYPKASECCFFMSGGDLCLSIQISPQTDPKAVMTYSLKEVQ